jgi:hypothetical protein
MISSSLAGMHTQFRTIAFHSRSEEQLQERLHLKISTSSLSAAIGALGSPLGGPHPKSDLAIDLYSGTSPIVIMDESNHRINFNLLNKSMISLLAVKGASGSPLGPHPERDPTIGLHSGSTPDSYQRRVQSPDQI